MCTPYSQIVGVFYRTASLLEKGIKPVFVFDGPAPRLKSRVLRKRHGWRPEAKSGGQACGTVPEHKEHVCGSVPEDEGHACGMVPEHEEHACGSVPEDEGRACGEVPEHEEHTCGSVPVHKGHTCELVEELKEHVCGLVPEHERHACLSIVEHVRHVCGPVPMDEKHACGLVPECKSHVWRLDTDRKEHVWRPALACEGTQELPVEQDAAKEGVPQENQPCTHPGGGEWNAGKSEEQRPTVANPESCVGGEHVVRNGRRDCQRLLTLLGVPYIEAPGEAEATCAALVKAGKVDCTATEDMDALPFGCTRLVRNVSARKDARVEEFSLPAILEALELTQEQFVDLCILMGCDYCEKIKGIGMKRALPLIQTHGSIEGVVRSLDQRRFPAPDSWPYQEARSLFLQPDVVETQDVRLEWGPLDEEGLVQLLVTERKVREKRVRSRIQRLRESLRHVERRNRTLTLDRQQRIDSFYAHVKAFHYIRPGADTHFRLSLKTRRTARRNLSRTPLRLRRPAPRPSAALPSCPSALPPSCPSALSPSCPSMAPAFTPLPARPSAPTPTFPHAPPPTSPTASPTPTQRPENLLEPLRLA
ncbi:uncharacterized protein [Narcine bancroftii]|uniref:uncharacterized protein n=1 Tax=Narcine bancroftii TaxID=1343680 RepID=UPI003831B5FC